MSTKLKAGTATSGAVIDADTTGILELQSGSTPTTAITIDAGQRTTFPTTISVGGATPSTSGAGISFPATQSASADANTLDDYEEGTWTPQISASSGSITSYTSSGTYVKIGRQVTLNLNYTITNNGTGSGYGNIGNFPFATNANGGSAVGRIGGTTGNTCTLDIGASSTTGALWTYSNGYPWATNAQSFMTITYQV